MTKDFGAVDIISRWFPFDYTDYYTEEMGSPLYRRMIAFQGFIDQGQLAEIKQTTQTIEANFQSGEKRTVNIDCGYLLRERFVLATGKNFAHRIYIGKSVYADLTLLFSGGGYQPLPWTYPDYLAADMQEFLLRVRNGISVIFRKAGFDNRFTRTIKKDNQYHVQEYDGVCKSAENV